MDLSNLKPAPGSTRKRKRLGRGVGSGKGGHSSSRGNKGQKSRTGNHSMPAWFEGGQMPLQRRVPKYGFKNPFRVPYRVINLRRLDALVREERVDPAQPVTPAVLQAAGQVGANDRVKILGVGDIDVSVNVEAHAFSKSAAAKIEAAGGSVTVLNP